MRRYCTVRSGSSPHATRNNKSSEPSPYGASVTKQIALESHKPAPVARIARQRAFPGKALEYETAVREMLTQMSRQPGFLSADLIVPESEEGEYQVVVRFSSAAELQAWDTSSVRRAYLERIRTVSEDEAAFRVLSGLEAWFADSVVPASLHPPRSRMSIITWIGIFPTVSLYLWLLGPVLAPLPFLVQTAVLTALIVPTMTWLVMPQLTRRMRGWLQAGRH